MTKNIDQEKIRHTVETVLERFSQGQINLGSFGARTVIAKEVARALADSDYFFLKERG